MVKAKTELKNFSCINGLGCINFSAKLIENIIKLVLNEHPFFLYKNYAITRLTSNYYEVSIELLQTTHNNFNNKEIGIIQSELLLVLRQSLKISCVLFVNIKYE